MEPTVETISVAEARDGLSRALRRFREDDAAEPVVIGSHRKPEAVLVPYRAFRRLDHARNPPCSLLEKLQERSSIIRRLAEVNRIGAVAVFGSVARAEDTPDSDIDLLVDPHKDASYFNLAQFAEDIQLLMDRPVDVVSRRALDATDDQHILAEAIPL